VILKEAKVIEELENFKKSVIWDNPPPQKIKVTQFNQWEVKCRNCENKGA